MGSIFTHLQRSPPNGNLTHWTPLHFCVYFQYFALARSLVQKGAIINAAASELHLFINHHETPTNLSLYSFASFSAWRKILHDEVRDLQAFVQNELLDQNGPLASKGWDAESLMKLLAFNFEPAVYPKRLCDQARFNRQIVSVEIDWQRTVQQFNYSQDVHELLQVLDQVETFDYSNTDDQHDAKSLETSCSRALSGQGSPNCSDACQADQKNCSHHKTPTTQDDWESPGNNKLVNRWVCVRCWDEMIQDRSMYSNSKYYTSSDESQASVVTTKTMAMSTTAMIVQRILHFCFQSKQKLSFVLANVSREKEDCKGLFSSTSNSASDSYPQF